VIAEGHGWFLRRYDRNRAIQFLNFIDALSILAIQRFDQEQLTKTSSLIKKFGDQSLTLADAHGLVIINERRISACWSIDRHLGLTGAKLVISAAGK
jgi:predicted nucleic acid-binding protein